jgi:hypothetical protein
MATLPPAHIDTLHARHESKSVIIHPNRNRSQIEIRHAKSAFQIGRILLQERKTKGVEKSNDSSFSGVKRRGRHLPWRTRIKEKQWATRQKAATKIGKGLPPPVRLLPTEQWQQDSNQSIQKSFKRKWWSVRDGLVWVR